MVHIDEHLKVNENIFQGPNGMKTVAITIDEDLHAHGKEDCVKNEKVGKGLHQTNSDNIDAQSSTSQA